MVLDSPTCYIDGCDKPRKGRYCGMHQTRIERHGNPHTMIAQRDRALPRREDHHAWSAVPTYGAIHQRLRKWRGPAKLQTCPCGKPARQWAYTGPRAAGVRLPHEADLTLYVAMCVSCHKRHDMAAIAAAERGAA